MSNGLTGWAQGLAEQVGSKIPVIGSLIAPLIQFGNFLSGALRKTITPQQLQTVVQGYGSDWPNSPMYSLLHSDPTLVQPGGAQALAQADAAVARSVMQSPGVRLLAGFTGALFGGPRSNPAGVYMRRMPGGAILGNDSGMGIPQYGMQPTPPNTGFPGKGHRHSGRRRRRSRRVRYAA